MTRAIFWLLLAIGLLGHVYAARVMGGSGIAYTHHILGFALILLVTGGIIAALGRWLWRTRPTVTLIAIGLVQALLGIWIGLAQLRTATGR